MAKADTKLEHEAAQSTTALGPLVGLAREDFVGAVALLLRETASDPARTIKHTQALGDDLVKILTGKSDLAPDPKDKRFKDPAWQYNPFFRAGAQYYLAMQKGMHNWLADLELDELERDRANFISNIIIDGLAPTNTLIGNPSAQKRLIDSGGLSLIKGLKNAYNDIVHNQGMVSQVDKTSVQAWRECRHLKRQRGLSRCDDGDHPVRPGDRAGLCDPAADNSAADQQDVHQ